MFCSHAHYVVLSLEHREKHAWAGLIRFTARSVLTR